MTKDVLNKTIYTRGEHGCRYQGVDYPVQQREIKDSSGAGDTFFAALICEYLQSEDIIKSIKFANKCSSRVVLEKGVTIL